MSAERWPRGSDLHDWRGLAIATCAGLLSRNGIGPVATPHRMADGQHWNPAMRRSREAKKLLANLLAAPGHVSVSDSAIRVTPLCAGNAVRRKSIDAFLLRVTAQRLTLPGNPAARPLAFRSQE